VLVRLLTAVLFVFLLSGVSRTANFVFLHAAQQLTVWDGVYTREQSDRGDKLYADRCAKCHGDALQGIEAAPALAGPAFYANWDGETVDALFERIRTSMPQDRPGSLTRTENADILAYMLRVGAYPSGTLKLDPQGGALARITVLMYRPEPK
jgi:mono/diheme cytochrome c family protein